MAPPNVFSIDDESMSSVSDTLDMPTNPNERGRDANDTGSASSRETSPMRRRLWSSLTINLPVQEDEEVMKIPPPPSSTHSLRSNTSRPPSAAYLSAGPPTGSTTADPSTGPMSASQVAQTSKLSENEDLLTGRPVSATVVQGPSSWEDPWRVLASSGHGFGGTRTVASVPEMKKENERYMQND
jgi:hypothetical protein